MPVASFFTSVLESTMDVISARAEWAVKAKARRIDVFMVIKLDANLIEIKGTFALEIAELNFSP